jgi:hypothetical protein
MDLYGGNRAGGVTKNLGYGVATEPELGVMLSNLGNFEWQLSGDAPERKW